MEPCGYVKANKLTSEYIIRQDMQEKGKAETISIEDYRSGSFDLTENNNTKKINVKTVFNIKENKIEIKENSEGTQSDSKIWVCISNKLLEKQINSILKEYKTRTNVINTIVNEVIGNNVNGVIIDFDNIEDDEKEVVKRFMIELTPKLREIGIDTCIVLNKNIEKNDYINVVDYIIE